MSTGAERFRRVVKDDVDGTTLWVAEILGVGSILAGAVGGSVIRTLVHSAPSGSLAFAFLVFGTIFTWIAISLFAGGTLATVAAASR